MILFIHGPETYLVRQKVNQVIAKALEQGVPATNVVRLDASDTELAALLGAFQNQGLFADRQVAVIRDGLTALSADDAEQLVAAAAQTGDETVVVLAEYGKPDKRRTAYKSAGQAAAKTWEFLELDQPAARRFAADYAKRQGYQIDAGALTALLEATGPDAWRLVTELDKLDLAAGDQPISEAVVAEQVESEVSGDIFTLVDAAGRRQAGPALTAFEALTQSGEPPLRILAMLLRQYRLLLVVHDLAGRGTSDEQIQTALGNVGNRVPPFVLRKLKSQAALFATGEVTSKFDQLAEIDYQIKTGRTEAAPALELFIVESATAA